MFRQILFTQLKWTRGLVVAMAAMAFLTPAMAWWMGGLRVAYPERPAAIILGFESVGPLLMLLSTLGALVLAAYPWMVDAQTKFVLPLSLPIPWRRYLAMRFGAGALTLLLPTLGLFLGSLFVLSYAELGPTLRSYPVSLAVRFLTASLLAYSVTFALQYTAGKRLGLVVLVILLTGALLAFVLPVLGAGELIDKFMALLFDAPGPLAIFSAEWKLVDV